MNKNRLHLDFSIDTSEERAQFINKYIEELNFVPTQSELNTMAEYVLWGRFEGEEKVKKKDRHQFGLSGKHGTWTDSRDESLEQLMEKPTFNENSLRKTTAPVLKAQKRNLSRAQIRQTAPPEVLEDFEALWKRIDQIDLIINFYEVAHNTRKKPPRDSLLKQFNESETQALKDRASQLSQYEYLKLRHQLVELRTDQYFLKDRFAPTIKSVDNPIVEVEEDFFIQEDINLDPVSMPDPKFLKQIFNPAHLPIPEDFTEEGLEYLGKILWSKEDSTKESINLLDEETWKKIIPLLKELKTMSQGYKDEDTIHTDIHYFYEVLDCYIQLLNLEGAQRIILYDKIEGVSNEQIQKHIEEETGKKYNINYISTIYCQKIIGGLVEIARKHRQNLEEVFYPENFKKCKDCGETFLRDSENFVRRTRSKDGFSCRCKSCEKKLRDKRRGK